MSLAIAWFITPHGYGHATRSIALMVALRRRHPETVFHIFSPLAANLFEESLTDGFFIHPTQCDVGLVQLTAMEADLDATLDQLEALFPFRPQAVVPLAQQVLDSGCKLVVCDIAAMGIAVAELAGLPSVLVENFTWDWIYRPFMASQPGFSKYRLLLKSYYAKATLHIQTQPVCSKKKGALQVGLIVRPLCHEKDDLEQILQRSAGRSLVLITMGGVAQQLGFLKQLHTYRDRVFFLIAGACDVSYDNILSLEGLKIYHPNLVARVDLVIGKLGYSTVAEVYQAGVPLVYVGRSNFRESHTMNRFVRDLGNTWKVSETRFLGGRWLKYMPKFLEIPHRERPVMDGATQAAEAIWALLEETLKK